MSRRQTSKPTSFTNEQQASRHTVPLHNCRQGHHTFTLTFRPGEALCTVCGLVTYCLPCLQVHALPIPTNRGAYALLCDVHQSQKAEVQV